MVFPPLTFDNFPAIQSLCHLLNGLITTHSCEWQRFRKGVSKRGLATNNAQNTAKILPQKCILLLIRGQRKKSQKKGRDLSSVRQPLFETSEDHMIVAEKVLRPGGAYNGSIQGPQILVVNC